MKRSLSFDHADGPTLSLAKPARAASAKLPGLPTGPSTYEEVFSWPLRMAQRACKMMEARNKNMDCEMKIVLTTAFSGVGMAETAVRMIREAFADIGCNMHVEFYAATEVQETCHQFLDSTHVFGNLLHRAERRVWDSLEQAQKQFVAEATTKAQGLTGAKKAKVWQSVSDQFLEYALRFLDNNASAFKATAYCYRCKKQCRWHPAPAEDTLWLDVGGNTCTPFSTRGHLLRFLDEANMAMFSWCFSMKHIRRPDYIVNECVPAMPASFFQSCFGKDVHVQPVAFSPVDCGIPCNRPRQYVIISFHGETDLSFTLDSLAELAFCTLEVTGSVFLQSSADDQVKFLQDMADARGIPPRADGRPHLCKMVMDVADKGRMEAFRQELVGKGRSARCDEFADIAQTVKFGNVSHCIPTIIRNSKVYSFSADRLLLPVELMGVQGLPALLSDSRWLGVVGKSLRDLPKDYAMREACQLLGNGMHLSQVGAAVIMCILEARMLC